ncbi:MAG: hypothetical protein K2P58_07200 [Hyphomonadaceae bacterium]|nr:hypothetical protein [Hyphomonadaceae bacterium]
MRSLIVVTAALIALSACQNAGGLGEGERLNWNCADGKSFSLRAVADGVEVFAAGQTHRLARVEGGQYSNGAVTYSENGEVALTGLASGPYERCRRARGDWWLDLW